MDTGERELKTLLRGMKENGWSVTGGNTAYGFATRMMECIGTPDPELRDGLVWKGLTVWIGRGLFTDTELLSLLDLASGEQYLFHGLGNIGDDTVFRRSFSVLIVASVLEKLRGNPALPEAAVKRTLGELIRYADGERDLRGYVEGKGWAHSAAHTSDAFGEIALYACLDERDLLGILGAIGRKMRVASCAYWNGEDERNADAALRVLERKVVPDGDIGAWFESFVPPGGNREYPAHDAYLSNVKSFLRSLFFRLDDDPATMDLQRMIRETLRRVL